MSINLFCTRGTSSVAISTPRSPRAIIIPSTTSAISRIFWTPCLVSILAMIFMSPPASSITFLTAKTSFLSLTKDTATKSTSCFTPQRMSSLSLSDMAEKEKFAPGTLTPLRLDKTPPTTIRHLTFSSSMDSILRWIVPSST